jgi:hypothetical protein
MSIDVEAAFSICWFDAGVSNIHVTRHWSPLLQHRRRAPGFDIHRIGIMSSGKVPSALRRAAPNSHFFKLAHMVKGLQMCM